MRRTPLKRKTLLKAKTPLKRSKLRSKRRKRSKREILRDKAWKTFSLWIRDRDKLCVTCGSPDHGQAGHFYHNVLDFDEININRQCARCNNYLSGNLAVYAEFLVDKYGVEEFKALSKRRYEAMKGEIRSERDYEAIIEKYTL